MIRFLLWSFSLLVLSGSAWTASDHLQPVVLSDAAEQTFDSHIAYIEDVDASFSHQDLASLPINDWSALPQKGISFGFSSSAYWLRFSVSNALPDPQLRYLLIDHPILDYLSVYQYENGKLISASNTGDALPFDSREVNHPAFAFPMQLDAGAARVILVRFQSEGSLQAPISIWEPKALESQNQMFLAFMGVFAGILVAMSLYNLFLYVSIKDATYLSYSFFALSALGFFVSIEGVAYQWLWPDSPVWHKYTLPFFNAVGCVSLSLFTLHYLEPKVGSKSYRVLRALVYASVVGLVGAFAMPYSWSAIYHSLLDICVILACLTAAVYTLGRSTERARFFLISWSAFLIGTILNVLSKSGVLPDLAIFGWFSMAGAIVGVMVLSFALADKIRAEREAKVAAQQQAIGNYQKFYSIYEHAREGIFVMDLEGDIVSANPAMRQCLGLDGKQDLSHDNPVALMQVLQGDQYKHFMEELLTKRSVVDFETLFLSLEGNTFWVLISAHLAEEADGHTIVEGSLININDRKEFENELQHLASHDSLTGFLNRHAFEEQTKALLTCVKTSHIDAAMLYLDLDQFKIVNDLCGHSAGDKLLRSLSIRLNNKLLSYGNEPIIARIGGDEFGILLPGFSSAQAFAMAEDLRQCIESFVFLWDSHRYPIGVSIGVVQFDVYHHSVEQLIIMADTACYMAKDQGRNRVHVFVESDKEIELRKHEMRWISVLRDATENSHFFLVAQQIASNQSQAEGLRYEVLLRLQIPGEEVVPPNQFLPAAERYRMMPQIDRWVIRTFFAWLADHPEHEAILGSASINLSTQSLGEASFADSLLMDFDEFGIDPSKICFEITESMAVTNMENTHQFISIFGELGCRFALDDFGTGFSSYAYLKELAVHYLKIDGMFVKNLIVDEVDEEMVRSVHNVATKMGIETIAEFVENEEIQSRLIDIGIQYSQGFHVAKPIRLSELLSWSAQGTIAKEA